MPRFNLGQVVITPTAMDALAQLNIKPSSFLDSHAAADWGDLDAEDKKQNDEAIAHEGDPDQMSRVLSSYNVSPDFKVWIITESDRSVTTILLPEDY